MDEGEKVASGLLVAGGDAAKLLDLVPKAFDQITVLVKVVIIVALLLAGAQARDDRLAAPGLDVLDELLAVVAFIPNDDLQWHALDQFLAMSDVRFLASGQDNLHRQPKPIDAGVDLSAEPASTSAETLLALSTRAVRFFGAPAA